MLAGVIETNATSTALSRPERDTEADGHWWRDAVVYQVYLRSFADGPRTRPFTTKELRDGLTSTLNGNGNIYRVPIKELLALK